MSNYKLLYLILLPRYFAFGEKEYIVKLQAEGS